MKKIFIIFIILFAVIGGASIYFTMQSTPCENEDVVVWNPNGLEYAPREAYEWGVHIKTLVAKKDLKGLYDLVKSDLNQGIKKETALQMTFDEVFSKRWQEKVLSYEPDCQPVGYRGFMLGHGMIWFEKSGKNDWVITTFNKP